MYGQLNDKQDNKTLLIDLFGKKKKGRESGVPFQSESLSFFDRNTHPEFVLLNLMARIIYNFLPRLIFKRFVTLSGSMRIILRILAVVILIISAAWFYSDQNFQSGLTVVGSLSGLISTFLFRQKGTRDKRQKQTVGDGSSGIQAGGDVNISIESRNSKDD